MITSLRLSKTQKHAWLCTRLFESRQASTSRLCQSMSATKVISENEHPHQAGRIRMSPLGKNGLRSNLASISRIAFLDSETPFW